MPDTEDKLILSKILGHQKRYKKLFSSNRNKELLYNWLKSELAYTSNHIEGNTLTRKETRLIIEEGITSSSKSIREYQETLNHAEAFLYIVDLLKSSRAVNEEVVLEIHRRLLKGIDDYNAGFYRNCSVRILGSRVVLPNYSKVPYLMEWFFKKLSDIKEVQDIIKLHLDFVSIHPFSDGNGRTARLLMNLLLMKHGFCPIIIRVRDRKNYISYIEKAQLSGKVEEYMRFMLTRLNGSFETIFDTFDSKNDIPQEKLLKISAFATAVNLPVSTIRYWVKMGKIKPTMYTESGYMLFSKEQVNKLLSKKNK